MCSAPKIPITPPAPAAPPVLEQAAPKSAKESAGKKKRRGLSSYRIDKNTGSKTANLGGIPTKTGV